MRKLFLALLLSLTCQLHAVTQVSQANMEFGPVTLLPSTMVTIGVSGWKSIGFYETSTFQNAAITACMGYFGNTVTPAGVTLGNAFGELPLYMVDGVMNQTPYQNSYRILPCNSFQNIIAYNEDAGTTVVLYYDLMSLNFSPGFNGQGFFYYAKNCAVTGTPHPITALDTSVNGAKYFSLQIADATSNTYDACTVNVEGSNNGGNFDTANPILSMSVTGNTSFPITCTINPYAFGEIRPDITSLTAGSKWNIFIVGH